MASLLGDCCAAIDDDDSDGAATAAPAPGPALQLGALQHGPVTALALTATRCYVGRNGTVTSYDLASGAVSATRRLLGSRIHGLAVGFGVGGGFGDATLCAWGVAETAVARIAGGGVAVASYGARCLDARFSGDGSIAVALADGRVAGGGQGFDVPWECSMGELRCAALSGASRLVGGDAFGRVGVRGAAAVVDAAHKGVVTAVAWAADDSFLSTSDDRTVARWVLRDGALSRMWAATGHTARVWGAVRAGNHVAAGVGINRRSKAGPGYLQTPLPR